MGTLNLQYPLDIAKNNNAFVTFSARESGVSVANITTYSPPSFSVTDGAAYGTFDLGVLLGAAVSKEGSVDQAGLSRAAASLTGQDASIQKALVLSASQKLGIIGETASRANDIFLQKRGVAINPNTVMQFNNAEFREFSFQFTMVAGSYDETLEIDRITNTFRKYMYASGDKVVLKYPSLWDIKFNFADEENLYMPKIKECYLTSLNVTFNPSGNGVHADGSPNEISVALSFRETKVLRREDLYTRNQITRSEFYNNGGS